MRNGALRAEGRTEGSRSGPAPAAKQEDPREAAGSAENHARLSLVLVEDDANERSLLVRVLEGRGHSCLARGDVSTALEAILANRPQVVVSDLRMPGLGGIELCKLLRQSLGIHAPPIVVVSGLGDVDSISEALDAGATHFVRKPYTAGEICAVVEHAARGPLPHVPSDQASDVPDRLGSFEILGELGRGGMSVVYRARSLTTGVEVVLKLLSPSAAHLDEHLRFHREYDLLAALAHPGLPRAFACSTDRGRTYLVLEFIRGEGLDVRLRRSGALPARDVASIGVHLGSTLAYLHERGIVHRDVKPSNVILREDGSPCLVDFGLARRGRDLAVTSPFEIFATPAYCAPELANPSAVTPRADVFSLGLLLYEALVGVHPLLGHLPDLTPLDLLLTYAREKLPDVRLRAPGVPGPFAELLSRAIAADPVLRPDAGQLVRELGGLLATSW